MSGNDEHPRDETNPQGMDTSDMPTQLFPANTPPAGKSRRNFLRAAVIASAATVAAGGAAGATLMATGKSPSSLIRFIGDVTLSPNDPCDLCSSTTNETGPLVARGTSGNPYTNTESMYIWVKFLGVGNGNYSFNLTPTIQTKGGGNCTGNPLSFGAGNNSIKVYSFANGPRNCIPNDLPSFLAGTLLVQQQTLPASFSVSGGPVDVVVGCHLQNDCSSAGVYTVTGTLTNTGPGTTTAPVSCSNDIHVQAG